MAICVESLSKEIGQGIGGQGNGNEDPFLRHLYEDKTLEWRLQPLPHRRWIRLRKARNFTEGVVPLFPAFGPLRYPSVLICESEAHLWPSVFVRKGDTEFVP